MSVGLSNNMTLLLNKLENRLGTKPLNLPDHLKKEKWADDVIIMDTLVTFSRYIPNQITYQVNNSTTSYKNGWYYLDEDIIGNAKILGIRDVDWDNWGTDSIGMQQANGYGIYDAFTRPYGLDDIAMLQMRADHISLFNNGIYIDWESPNRFRLMSASGTLGNSYTNFPILILVEHSPNLTTISPTQMETFEALAQADVASYLYKGLRYYDQLPTVFGGNIDLKLDELQNEASRREEVINYIKESYVSAGNKNAPIMLCI